MLKIIILKLFGLTLFASGICYIISRRCLQLAITLRKMETQNVKTQALKGNINRLLLPMPIYLNINHEYTLTINE